MSLHYVCVAVGTFSNTTAISSVLELNNEVIPHTNQWVNIGLNLELSYTDIDRIRIDFNDEERRFMEVLNKWQKNGNPSFTWNTLVQVLQSPTVNEHQLAEKIRDKFFDK